MPVLRKPPSVYTAPDHAGRGGGRFFRQIEAAFRRKVYSFSFKPLISQQMMPKKRYIPIGCTDRSPSRPFSQSVETLKLKTGRR
jgi:hypothetical protein